MPGPAAGLPTNLVIPAGIQPRTILGLCMLGVVLARAKHADALDPNGAPVKARILSPALHGNEARILHELGLCNCSGNTEEDATHLLRQAWEWARSLFLEEIGDTGTQLMPGIHVMTFEEFLKQFLGDKPSCDPQRDQGDE